MMGTTLSEKDWYSAFRFLRGPKVQWSLSTHSFLREESRVLRLECVGITGLSFPALLH